MKKNNIIKKESSLDEFYYKLGELKNLCHFFENTVIKGSPEERSDNFEMLEELFEQADNSSYSAITEALFEIKEDLERRYKTCEEIYLEEKKREDEAYYRQVMSEESHLNPKLILQY